MKFFGGACEILMLLARQGKWLKTLYYTTAPVVYLGIEIDSVAQVVRLQNDKLDALMTLLQSWLTRSNCTKRELLSLIGSLSFACKVVKPGRIFLRRLIDLSTTVTELHHNIYFDTESKADVDWWLKFLPSWNGVECFQHVMVTSHSLQLFTDASSLGFGAVYRTHWFSSTWPTNMVNAHINVQELFAIVAAVFTWGHVWVNQQVLFYTDNSCIVHVWKTGTCRNKDIMKLVRSLFLFAARRDINILMQHVSGVNNISADALSRFQIVKFRKLMPSADLQPTPISTEVWRI